MNEQITQAWIASDADRKAVEHGCYFDPAAGWRVVKFFHRFLRHSTGKWGGKRFVLLPWERRILYRIFGWKRADGSRRFRIVYIEVPKKNGKSALSSGLALYLEIADGEPGAQVYCAAADRDQATIVFRECDNMVDASPPLRERLKVIRSTKVITHQASGSFLKALSAEAYTKEGINIHGLIFDELHAQKTRELWDALRYGGAARRQPLIISITTAGFDRHSICWEQHDYAQKVAAGIIEDDSFFGCIFAAGEEDDWTKEETWFKANPSLGITIDLASFAADCKEARQSPAKENSFKRYRLNIWTQQETLWLPMDKWRACAAAVEGLKGMKCYGGLDLASTIDIAAFALYFPELLASLTWFWIPRENAIEREHRDRVPYTAWEREGLIELTDGNEIDFSFIRQRVKQSLELYDVRKICYDPWNAADLSQQIRNDGYANMEKFPQTIANFTGPSKRLEAMILDGTFRHGGNPILTWMASNTAVKCDANQNIRPVKPPHGDHRKIDGIVALIMAIGGSMVAAESNYDGNIMVLGA